MVEKLKINQDILVTWEYAKKWTETSPLSKLNQINGVLSNPKLKNIKEISILKTKISKREYREFQKMVWVPFNRCDGKLWKESIEYFVNYINKLIEEWNATHWTNSFLWKLKYNVTWLIDNVVWRWDDITWNNNSNNQTDTLHIQHNEAQYLASHETMSQSEYDRLFSWRNQLQQWQLGDCYLVSWINELARAQHFDTLMRTSIKRRRWDNWVQWYQIKIPLWEPSWRKILLTDSEVKVAKIKGNTWYKLLELAYAKNRRPNNTEWNKYKPITPTELKKIKWWWTKEVLETFLWKHNISFNTFWDKNREKSLNKISSSQKSEITWFLKNYVPNIWNKFVSLSSIWWKSDTEQYSIGGKTMYHKHSYALTWVNKDSKWNIKTITVLNPWNTKWSWKNYMSFTPDEFFKAFSYMSCGKIKAKTFLDNKWMA
jgi:hypothetical protein